jgi:hypothetical protein
MTDTLKLGDIIEWNENVYLVEYLDADIIILKTESGETSEYSPEDLEDIILVGRNPKEGYAEQNGLIVGKKIRISLGDPIRKSLKGYIRNLKHDEIEVELKDGQTIFINFNYKGIPRNLPIEKIEVYSDKEPEIFIEYIEVPEERKRFPIQLQINDLLEHMISKVSIYQRTPHIIDTIQRHVERYKYLRTISSVFDEYGNIKHPIEITKDEPINDVSQLKKSVPWIIPVINHNSIVYGADDDTTTDVETRYFGRKDDEEDLETYDGMEFNLSYYENYKFGNTKQENVYNYYVKSIRKLLTAYNAKCEYPTATQTEVDAILNNLGDFNSSRAENDRIVLKPFHRVRLTFGESKLVYSSETTELKKRDIIGRRVPIYGNDEACINGFIILDTPYITYSKAYLPSSTILERSTIAQTPYTLNNEEVKLSNDLSSLPKISDLLQEKREIYTPSLYAIVRELETYLVYLNDLKLPHYKIISDIIEKQIQEIKNIQKKHQTHSSSIRKLTHSGNTISTVLYDAIKGKIKDTYGNAKFNEEMMSSIMNHDMGRLYTSMLALEEAHLLLVKNVRSDLEELLSTIKTTDETSCKQKIRDAPRLSKIYYSISKLEEDTSEIFYDTKLDDTEYELRDYYFNEYKNVTIRQPTDTDEDEHVMNIEMSDEDFIIHLSKKLKENDGFMRKYKAPLNDRQIRKIARNMVKGVKPVEEGDYAVLISTKEDKSVELKTIFEKDVAVKYQYFVRRDNKWVEDTKYKGSPDMRNAFCNINEKCIIRGAVTSKDLGQCVGLEHAILQEQKREVNELLLTFKEQLEGEIADVQKELTIQVRKQMVMFKVYSSKYEEDILKNNNYKRLIVGGLTRSQIEETIISSPYNSLRDRILNSPDMDGRMRNILKFVSQYTRSSNDTEDAYWLYCKETNARLLPVFFKRLAEAYQTNTYDAVLEEICSNQGQISDDGDKIVDRHSGYVIRLMEFSTKEGFDEDGHVIAKRLTVEERNPEEAQFNIVFTEYEKKREQNDKEKTKYTTNEQRNIIYYLSLLSSNVRIELDNNERIRMIEMSIRIYEKISPKLKTPEDKMVYMIGICSAVFITIVQISMPSKRLTEGFAGCISSLRGYPVYDETHTENTGMIHYVSCILKKLSQTLPKLETIKSKNMSKYISNIIEKYGVYSHFETEIIQKRTIIYEWLKDSTEKRDIVLDRHEYLSLQGNDLEDIQRWTTFLPPLKRVTIKKIHQTGDIQNRILQLTLSMVDKIQTIVDKDPEIKPLLVTSRDIGYLQNICCQSIDILNPYDYFYGKDKTLKEVRNEIRKLESVMKKDRLSKIKLSENTRMVYPPIDEQWREQTIYNIIIYHAKRMNDLTEKMTKVKNMEFSILDDLEQRIKQIKQSDIDFNVNEVRELLVGIADYKQLVKNDYDNMKKSKMMKEIKKFIIQRQTKDVELQNEYIYDLVSDGTVNDTSDYEIWASNYGTAERTDDLISAIELLKKELSNLLDFSRFGHISLETGYGYVQQHEYIDNYSEYVVATFLHNMLYMLYEFMNIDYTIGQGTDMPRIWDLYYKYGYRHIEKIKNIIQEMKKTYSLGKLEDDMDESWRLTLMISNVVVYSFKKTKSNIENTYARLLMEYLILKMLNKYTKNDELKKYITAFFGKNLNLTADGKISKSGIFGSMFNIVLTKKEDIQNKVIENTEFEKKKFIERMKQMDRSSRQAELLMKEMKIGNWKETGQYRDYDEGVYEREDEMRRMRQGINDEDLEASAEGYTSTMKNDDESDENINDEN